MESTPEMLEAVSLSARLLITAATLAYGVGPFIVDMNRTHLLHPAWPGHARFHLLWAAVGQFLVSLIALRLVWADGPDLRWRCQLAILIGICFVSAFFVAWVAARWYRGTLSDPGGVKPILGFEGNILACLIIDGLFVTAWILL